MKKSNQKHRIVYFYKLSLALILVCFSTSVSSQIKIKSVSQVKVMLDSISGVVSNAITHKPLAGAQIQSLDAKYSAMTEDDGTFKIKLSKKNRTLIAFAPGYEKVEIPIYSGDRKKRIALYPALNGNYFDQALSVFGPKRNATVTNSQKSISIDNLSSITLDDVLQKSMAGELNLVAHSGSPASGLTMLIRGINSLNATTQPLIVIDGVINDNQNNSSSIHLGNIINPLAGLEVNDIQYVSVLKDGTSLYGSKGANGVILITTNRGRDMVTRITASAMLGHTDVPKLTPMLNSNQYRVYLTDLLKDKSAQTKLGNQYFYNDDPSYIFYNQYHNNTNWSDGVYTAGNAQSYNVSVNGGDEIALYNLSIGYTNELSTLKESSFNRLNARFNSDIILTKNLKTAFDISYLQSNKKLHNDGLAEVNTGQINSPAFLALIKSPFLSPYQYSNFKQKTLQLENYDFINIANPYAVLKYGIGESDQTNFNLSLMPTYTFSKSLKLSSRFSYSMTNLSENMFSPMYGVAPYIIEGVDKYYTSTQYTSEQVAQLSSMINPLSYSLNYVQTQFDKQTSMFNDTRLNFAKVFGYSSYEVNAGMRYLNNNYVSEYASGHNTGTDQITEMSKNLSFKQVGGLNDPYKLLTYYGVFDYSFKDKYIIEATATAESSSRFGSNTASGFQLMGVSWGVFPSVNASWLVSSENFMKSIRFVNLLKIRAGYGLSGNDNIPNTASNAYLSAIKYTGTLSGIVLNNLANPQIQWETATKRNIGLEASIFNNRLSFSVDLYNNTTSNLLVQKNLNSISGVDLYWANDGKLENKGYEIAFNAEVVRLKNLSVTVGASVAHNANKILSLANGDYNTTIYGADVRTAVGQSIGQFYGYKTNGVFATTAEAATLKMQTNTGVPIPFEAGEIRFVDQSVNGVKDGVIDEKDKVVIGNSNPDLFGSFNAGIKYKGLGIQCIFNYSYGNDVYNYLRTQLESGSSFYNQTTALNNRWLVEGQVTNIPKSVYGDPHQNNRFSDRWIEDGSYLKLKTIQISYELPKASFLNGITVWASVNNLWTLTKYLGTDPEFSASNQPLYKGIDTGLLPQSKSYFAGVKINL